MVSLAFQLLGTSTWSSSSSSSSSTVFIEVLKSRKNDKYYKIVEYMYYIKNEIGESKLRAEKRKTEKILHKNKLVD